MCWKMVAMFRRCGCGVADVGHASGNLAMHAVCFGVVMNRLLSVGGITCNVHITVKVASVGGTWDQHNTGLDSKMGPCSW